MSVEKIIITKFSTPVKCVHCEYSVNNSMALEQHMDSEHQESEVIPRIDTKSDDSKDPE